MKNRPTAFFLLVLLLMPVAATTPRDTTEWIEIGSPFGHQPQTFAVAPNGSQISLIGQSGWIKVWDNGSSSWAQTTQFQTGSTSLVATAYSPDGTFLVTDSEGVHIHRWNTTTWTLEDNISNAHSSTITSLAVSPTGAWIASTSADRTVRVWDVATGSNVWTSPTYSSSALEVEFQADGSRLYAVLQDQVQAYTIPGWANTSLPANGTSNIRTMALSPSWLAYGHDDGRVDIVDANSDMAITNFQAPGSTEDLVRSMDFSPNGSLLFTASRDRYRVWNTTSWTNTGNLSTEPGCYPNHAEFSVDGQGLAVRCVQQVHLYHFDDDADGWNNSDDAFPQDPGEWNDSDGDGTGDNSDDFPHDANETTDSDGDGIGDNSDPCPGDPFNLCNQWDPVITLVSSAAGPAWIHVEVAINETADGNLTLNGTMVAINATTTIQQNFTDLEDNQSYLLAVQAITAHGSAAAQFPLNTTALPDPPGNNTTGNDTNSTGNGTTNETSNGTGNETGGGTGNETGNTTGNGTGNQTGNGTGNQTTDPGQNETHEDDEEPQPQPIPTPENNTTTEEISPPTPSYMSPGLIAAMLITGGGVAGLVAMALTRDKPEPQDDPDRLFHKPRRSPLEEAPPEPTQILPDYDDLWD